MSQKAKYAVELERISRTTLAQALKEMVRALDAERIVEREFRIYRDTIPVKGTCIKFPGAMFPIDVFVDEHGKLIINGDEMDVERVGKKVKQFYKGVAIARVTGARLAYSKERKKVQLRMKV